MGPYHIMLSHFPLALWTTAMLIIVLRTFSNCSFAKSCDNVLTPLLGFATLTGIMAFAVGLLVWPIESIINSPLARNHLLFSSWALALWMLVWITRWNLGEAIWQGPYRWIMLLLAALGAGLLTITGTLGGHLSGGATAVSEVLRLMGWEVYTTFYVPNFMLILLFITTLVLVFIPKYFKLQRGVYD